MHLVKNAQEREKLQETPPIGNIAPVAGVYSDGIALILPGDTEATEKHYPYNASATFAVGQRVHIERDSGTIIVEYPIGGNGS